MPRRLDERPGAHASESVQSRPLAPQPQPRFGWRPDWETPQAHTTPHTTHTAPHTRVAVAPLDDDPLERWLREPEYWVPPAPSMADLAAYRRGRRAQSALVAAAVAAVATAGVVGGAPAATARTTSENTDQFPIINAATVSQAATSEHTGEFTGVGGPGAGLTHVVEPGDTLFKIAQRYGVPLHEVIAANDFPNPDLIYPGQHVNIPGEDAEGGVGGGLTVEVKPGDTVFLLAQRYGVSMESIIAANKLANPHLIYPGDVLTIPGASAPAEEPAHEAAPAQEPAQEAAPAQEAPAPQPAQAEPEPAPAAQQSSTGFIWPARGTITQRFGPSRLWLEPAYQGYAHFHQGLDIANVAGTPIAAAASGTVTFAGWHGSGYGFMVQIDHGNGLSTLYAHMASQPWVSVGQWVEQGQHIGPIGSTGASTGPHLHFAVQRNGVWENPEHYLP